jgi:hypothetical protein
MNSPNRHINSDNYEVWMIDYIDGKLSGDDLIEVQHFLTSHPHLLTEINELAGIQLRPEGENSYPFKSRLRRAPAPFDDLSEYDYLLARVTEKDLSVNEQKQLYDLSQKSDEVTADFHCMSRMKLQPTDEVYPYRSQLYRKSLIPAGLWWKTAAAAVLIFFFLSDRGMIDQSVLSPKVAYTPETETIDGTKTTMDDNTINKDVVSSIVAVATAGRQKTQTLASQPTSVTAEESVQEKGTEVISTITPRFKTPVIIGNTYINCYEEGLSLMLPHYLKNRRLLASSHESAEPDDQPGDEMPMELTTKTTRLLGRITPFNLAYTRKYNEEGRLVAINVKSDNFELEQRVGRLR